MIDDIALLRETIRIADAARAEGNHPFGALLSSDSGEILIRSGNTFRTDKGIGHAELNVARLAATRFDATDLEGCTLYTSVEPCSMCAGSTYWSGIGHLVFGLTEERLAELTGDNPENLTMSLPCRQVLDAGQRRVEVRGPFPELEGEIVASHLGFW
jgi:tRNA(Arg) A34 adenosine deaminase TadA